jgi:hypothetical protein
MARDSRLGGDLHRALGDVLGEIADPLQIAGDANGPEKLAQVHRHRLPARNRHHGQILDLALQRVEARIGRDDLMGERRVGVGERVHGVDHHFLGEATHFGDAALERVELPVVGLEGMFDQRSNLTAYHAKHLRQLTLRPTACEVCKVRAFDPVEVRFESAARLSSMPKPYRRAGFNDNHQSLPEPKVTLL